MAVCGWWQQMLDLVPGTRARKVPGKLLISGPTNFVHVSNESYKEDVSTGQVAARQQWMLQDPLING